MDLVFCAFAVLAFSSVILMVEGLYLWWASARGAGARRIARRLGLVSQAAKPASPRISIVKHRSYGQAMLADMLLRRAPLTGMLDRRLAQAGVRWSVAQFLALSGMLLGVGLLVVQIWPMPAFAAFIVCALFTAIPAFLLARAPGPHAHAGAAIAGCGRLPGARTARRPLVRQRAEHGGHGAARADRQ